MTVKRFLTVLLSLMVASAASSQDLFDAKGGTTPAFSRSALALGEERVPPRSSHRLTVSL